MLFIFIMVYNVDNCWISSLENLMNDYNYLPHRQFEFHKRLFPCQINST
ncbi:hypothetical protein GCWU000321_00558 [Dialister invisus DSM 15470]|uniref:Uncharacterized protein n=1 Tax=Dialister invisus DSM 15470 TaxID=592028 RepID=C9LM26_9FIRM|nr:hypothetical protein GCWU000321_00558 [Dialister invisus DSM 15470]